MVRLPNLRMAFLALAAAVGLHHSASAQNAPKDLCSVSAFSEDPGSPLVGTAPTLEGKRSLLAFITVTADRNLDFGDPDQVRSVALEIIPDLNTRSERLAREIAKDEYFKRGMLSWKESPPSGVGSNEAAAKAIAVLDNEITEDRAQIEKHNNTRIYNVLALCLVTAHPTAQVFDIPRVAAIAAKAFWPCLEAVPTTERQAA